MTIKTSYVFQMPSRWTFDMPQVRRWTLARCKGKVLNVFCGKNKMDGWMNCDIDPEVEPDVLCDAMELDKHFEPKSFDTAIMDPPYSFCQVTRKYQGRNVKEITVVKEHLRKIVNHRIIWFGWNIPTTKDFEKKEILLVGHGGNHNATICTLEVRRDMNNEAIL